jgi:hypothetical protein
MLAASVGVAAMGAWLVGCAAPTQADEHPATTTQAESITNWPINSDCSCPDPSVVGASVADQCAFAQQFLHIIYTYNMSWNGGRTLSSDPLSGGSCNQSSLPPLTKAYEWWSSNGDGLQTPTLNGPDVNSNNGFYNATEGWGGLAMTPGPNTGSEFFASPVMFDLVTDSYNGNWSNFVFDFEPIKCSTCSWY